MHIENNKWRIQTVQLALKGEEGKSQTPSEIASTAISLLSKNSHNSKGSLSNNLMTTPQTMMDLSSMASENTEKNKRKLKRSRIRVNRRNKKIK